MFNPFPLTTHRQLICSEGNRLVKNKEILKKRKSTYWIDLKKKIVTKGKLIQVREACLILSQCFQQPSAADAKTCVCIWERVQTVKWVPFRRRNTILVHLLSVTIRASQCICKFFWPSICDKLNQHPTHNAIYRCLTLSLI